MLKSYGLWFIIILCTLFYWGVKAQTHLWWAENISAYPALFILTLAVVAFIGLGLRAWIPMLASIGLIIYFTAIGVPKGMVSKGECRNSVRLFQYNMLFSNQHVDQLIDYLSRVQPDLVLLQEVTAQHLEQLKVLDDVYRYRFGGQPKVGLPSHQLIFSRQPLYGMDVFYIEGYQNLIRGIWQVDEEHPVFLLTAHPPSPRNKEMWLRRNALIQALEYQATQSPTKDILIIGDMNLSANSERFDTLFSGMQTAPIASWPNLPTLTLPSWLQISIDHLWLNSDFAICKRESIDEVIGSDHRAIMTYLNIQ